jgi:hypothetical protein
MAVRELPALAQATAEWPTAVVPSRHHTRRNAAAQWPTLWTIVPSGKNARTTAPAKEGVPYGISGASYWFPVTIPLSVTYCHARAGMPPLHLRITHLSSPSLIAAELESGGTHGAAAMSRSDGTVAHPLVDAQKQRSRAESGSATEPLVAMHMRSEAASAVEKAQQQPAAPHCANAIRLIALMRMCRSCSDADVQGCRMCKAARHRSCSDRGCH